MSTDNWSPYILTFVTFAPLVGALLLVFFPRRDRDIRGAVPGRGWCDEHVGPGR